jgi:hypothetical protein
MAVHRLRIRLAALKRGRVRRPFAIGAAAKAEENAGAS